MEKYKEGLKLGMWLKLIFHGNVKKCPKYQTHYYPTPTLLLLAYGDYVP